MPGRLLDWYVYLGDNMTNMTINDNFCWVCGQEKANITVHHGLPSHLKPKNNVLIPVCRDCHDRINEDDVNGMYSYVFKMNKQIEEATKNLAVITKLLDENTKLKKIKSGEKIVLGGEI